MSRWSLSARGRITLASTAAVLLGALALRPTIEGWSWFGITVIVVLPMAMAGAAVRQVTHWWVPVVGAQLLTIVLTITALFAHAEALGGMLPDAPAIRALNALLLEGLEITRVQAPPVRSGPAVLMVVATGMALVAFAVDLLAVTMRRPAVAGLPLLAVYCVPSAVLPDGLPWFWFAVASLGFLLLISADAADRIRSWGRMLGDTRFDRDPGQGVSRWVAGGGARAGATALTIAVILPVLIPGLHDSLIGGSETGPGRNADAATYTIINPILDLRRDLTARTDRVVLTYQTSVPEPEPLRIVSADSFDGTTWSPSPSSLPPAENLASKGLPSPPGLESMVRTAEERTTVTVGPLNQNYLPLPYPATKVAVGGPWLYDSRSLNVIGNRMTTRGLRYSVDHLRVLPTSAQLDGARYPSSLITDTYTRLPGKGVPDLVRQTALSQAGSGSSFARAVRLQEFLRTTGGFEYSEEAPGDGHDDSGLDVMEQFLRNRRGYCVHFASAMAVMARTLGIASRVSVGFLPGDQRNDGTWEVSLRDVHAWPELYFQGAGWVRFEPTPASRAGTAPEWTSPVDQGQDSPGPTPTATAAGDSAAQAETRQRREDGRRAGWTTALGGLPWRVVAVLVLLVVLGLLPVSATWVRRRSRWRRSTDRVAMAETAWEELRERLGDLGVSWSRSRTPRAVQAWLGEQTTLEKPESAALGRLVTDLESARYVRPGAVGGREREAMVSDVRTVTRAVTRSVPPATRQRARWLPPSALGTLAPDMSTSTLLEPPPVSSSTELDEHLLDAPR